MLAQTIPHRDRIGLMCDLELGEAETRENLGGKVGYDSVGYLSSDTCNE